MQGTPPQHCHRKWTYIIRHVWNLINWWTHFNMIFLQTFKNQYNFVGKSMYFIVYGRQAAKKILDPIGYSAENHVFSPIYEPPKYKAPSLRSLKIRSKCKAGVGLFIWRGLRYLSTYVNAYMCSVVPIPLESWPPIVSRPPLLYPRCWPHVIRVGRMYVLFHPRSWCPPLVSASRPHGNSPPHPYTRRVGSSPLPHRRGGSVVPRPSIWTATFHGKRSSEVVLPYHCGSAEVISRCSFPICLCRDMRCQEIFPDLRLAWSLHTSTDLLFVYTLSAHTPHVTCIHPTSPRLRGFCRLLIFASNHNSSYISFNISEFCSPSENGGTFRTRK